MGQSVFPAPSAASKTRYVVTLLSGTSWTVPAGCLYVNAKLSGAGGGGAVGYGNASGLTGYVGQQIITNVTTTPGASITYAIGAGGTSAAAGGNTTFTGATTASGGATGQGNSSAAGLLGAAGGNGGPPGGNPGYTGSAGSIELEYWL